VPPIDSGIVHNNVSRLSNQRSIFHYARDAGLKTAAAAYHWVSELYNRSPFVRPRPPHRRPACRSSTATSTGTTTTPIRTCLPTPKTCACATRRTSCWCTR
jgi:hypothetical protein